MKNKVNKYNSEGKWEPLKLEGDFLSDGGIQGLIGIEELTDYNWEKESKTSKRKQLEENLNEAIDDELIKQVEKKKKTSKQTNQQTKVRKPRLNDEAFVKPEDIVESDEESSGPSDFNSAAWASLGVPSVIIKALKDQNFTAPTNIQSLTLAPAILGRRDVLGAAETGSGKTLAFAIPILAGIMELKAEKQHDTIDEEKESMSLNKSGSTNDNWIVSSDNESDQDNDNEFNDDDDDLNSDEDNCNNVNEAQGIGCVKVIDNMDFSEITGKKQIIKKPLYALILTPTRELAIQIKNHMCKAAKYTGIKIAVVVGGMAAVKQERILSKGPEIVIATPGRLWELIDHGNEHLSQLPYIKYLAIDETDRMLEKGHFQELHQIVERMNINELAVKQRQTFVFSATLTLVHDIPDYLQRKKNKNSKSKIFKLTSGQKLQKVIHMLHIKNPKIVDVTQERGTAGTLTECRITCTIDHKDYYLYYFLQRHHGRTLIFCNSIGCVKRLAQLFSILDCHPLPLHASMQQRQRLKNLEKFQEDPNGILVATDVAARGLDIPNVEHVIHYQVPRTSESYVHRSGRTARAQKEGITVLMMEPSELQNYTKLCKTLGHTQDIPTFPVIDKLLISVKERINIAREIDKLELMSRRDNVQKGWLKNAIEEMDLILDEDQLETTMESKETADLKRQLKSKRKELERHLSTPLFPKGFSGKYLEQNIDTPMLHDNSKTAIQVMKQSLIDGPKIKKRKIIISAQQKQEIINRKKNMK
ncbi:ATP-dependent RNA helicase DDX24-like, partial [Aphidius gifuensis]